MVQAIVETSADIISLQVLLLLLFLKNLFLIGPFASYKEKVGCIIQQALDNGDAICNGLLSEEIKKGLAKVLTLLQDEKYFHLPIVLELHDVAPKNILVDTGK